MGWLTARIGWGETDRWILALALPALGALVAEPLYILADTAVVGNLGTPQLAGLALAWARALGDENVPRSCATARLRSLTVFRYNVRPEPTYA